MSDEVTMPVEATIPLPTPDPDKEVMLRAAVAYDNAKQEREKLLAMGEKATIALEVSQLHVNTLEATLTAERDNHVFLQKAYEDAIRDRADLEALLAVEQDHHEDRAARLAKFEFSRLRNKRNGKRTHRDNGGVNAVSDALGSAGEVADATHLVASGPE